MNPTIEDIEFKLLLEAIFSRYGYDFRDYSKASLKRRTLAVLARHGLPTLSQLQERVLHDEKFFARIFSELTITTSEMFRDPLFFKTFREQIIPVLRTWPAFKIWHAGCSTGEEVYSMAILLEEEGLYDRAVLYATDINPLALQKAKEGIYSLEDIKQSTTNYLDAGGRESFSTYYRTSYGSARLDPALRRNVLFTRHNLVTDDVFSEIHVVLCRNVLIYFERSLQNRVLDLFARSLRYKGFLGLGSVETLRFMECRDQFEGLVTQSGVQIYRKIAPDSKQVL